MFQLESGRDEDISDQKTRENLTFDQSGHGFVFLFGNFMFVHILNVTEGEDLTTDLYKKRKSNHNSPL